MYKNAWKCQQCPERNDQDGCPAWIDGVVETNVQTGEIRVVRQCMLPKIPEWFTLVIQSANRAAKAAEITRNKTVESFEALIGVANGALVLHLSDRESNDPGGSDKSNLHLGMAQIDR